MNPIEASTILATLVGLICNWKQERGSQATDRFQDFMVWLSHHHFESLRERIFASDELQRQLGELLQQDLADLGAKLDAIAGAISSVADKIDTLSQVGRALGASAEALSDQAAEILKFFDQSGAIRLLVSDFPRACVFLPENRVVQFSEARFVEADVAALESLGFINLVDQNSSGSPIYALTRAGTAFASTLPELAI